MSTAPSAHRVPAGLLLGHPAAGQHLLHVGPVPDVLPEVTDVAADLLVGLEAEGDDGDEAEGEPLPALHGARAEVAAVLALHGEVLGASELGLEGVCAAGEEKEHGCGWWCDWGEGVVGLRCGVLGGLRGRRYELGFVAGAWGMGSATMAGAAAGRVRGIRDMRVFGEEEEC